MAVTCMRTNAGKCIAKAALTYFHKRPPLTPGTHATAGLKPIVSHTECSALSATHNKLGERTCQGRVTVHRHRVDVIVGICRRC